MAPWASRRDKPPLGNTQDQSSVDLSPLSLSCRPKRELSERNCLRKGCSHRYYPRRWNQRYCQAPECQRELRRWQAAKRQRRRRETAEGRERHRDRERQRRERQRQQPPVSPARSEDDNPCRPDSGAWSRSKEIPEDFCDRPGCYEPTRPSPRTPAKYCGDECRTAMANVRDRERKWLMRHTFGLPVRRTMSRGCGRRPSVYSQNRHCPVDAAPSRLDVVDYRWSGVDGLSFSDHPRSSIDDHQRDSSTRPRPPPTAQ